MTRKIIALLDKVFSHMLSSPGILYGYYDISFPEAAFIEENEKIPLEIMEILAIDHYFELECEKYDLTYKEACFVSDFLKNGSIESKYKFLKPYFHYIVKKI
ncbi:MAG: hypothetical protein Q8N98_02765 [bacterium]|nr:hypothetical protein [bacterium]